MKNNYFIIVLLFVLILTACENITGYIGRNNIENSIDRLNSNYKKLENNSITKGSIKEFKGHSQQYQIMLKGLITITLILDIIVKDK